MDASRSDSGLSPEAQRLLREYQTALAERILKEAARLNPTDILTARDIKDAYKSVSGGVRARETVVALTAARQGDRDFSRRLVLAATTLAVLASISGVAAFWVKSRSYSSDSDPLVFVALSVTIAVGLVVALIPMLARLRRSQREDMRLAERLMTTKSTGALQEFTAYSGLSSAGDREFPHLAARFLFQWGRLEADLRELAETAIDLPESKASSYPISLLLKELVSARMLSEETRNSIRQIMSVRNELVHRGSASRRDMEQCLELMETMVVRYER